MERDNVYASLAGKICVPVPGKEQRATSTCTFCTELIADETHSFIFSENEV